MKILSYGKRRQRLLASFVIGEKILDIGHAEMPNSYLSEFDSTGFDLKHSGSDQIYKTEIQGDVESILNILENKKYDTIICAEFIEHLENPYALLRNLKHLLNHKGRLLISTPNPLGFPVFICELLRIEKFFFSKDHKYLFTARWVKRMLEETGYVLKEIRPVGLWFFPVIPFCPTSLSWQIIYIAEKATPKQ